MWRMLFVAVWLAVVGVGAVAPHGRATMHAAPAPGARAPRGAVGGEGTMELIRAQGFEAEEHAVETEDGYILTMHRIVPKKKGAPAVLLQHGLLEASWTWVFNNRRESLGFLLADAGYDVFLGNVRGNVYARNHTHLSVRSDAFWDFSFDEMATYDLPALVDAALRVSGAEQLAAYVGHSQGTRIAFQAFSTNATVAARVAFFGALAPVAWLGHVDSLLLHALADVRLAELLGALGVRDFLPHTALFAHLFPHVCEAAPRVCSDVLFGLCGHTNDLNATRYALYVTDDPAGTSVRNMVHYTQGVRKDVFAAFDFGSAVANRRHYGRATPPEYQPGAMMVRTALFSGGNDKLADPTDVERLRKALPANMLVGDVTVPTYGHLDFVWGEHANDTVYAPLLEMIHG